MEAKQSIKDLAEQAVKMPWEDRAPYECRRDFKDAIEPELFLAMLAALDGLMALESRGRIMPIGKEWDAARAALAKATEAL